MTPEREAAEHFCSLKYGSETPEALIDVVEDLLSQAPDDASEWIREVAIDEAAALDVDRSDGALL